MPGVPQPKRSARLAEGPASATLAQRRRLFQRKGARRTGVQDHCPKPGRARSKQPFVGGWIEAHPLLGIAEQAAVQHDALAQGQGVVSIECSSGVARFQVCGHAKRFQVFGLPLVRLEISAEELSV